MQTRMRTLIKNEAKQEMNEQTNIDKCREAAHKILTNILNLLYNLLKMLQNNKLTMDILTFF